MAGWVIAVMTICYTIGTFLLWRETRRNIKQSEEAFKLSVLASFMAIIRPVYGMNQTVFAKYSEFTKPIKKDLIKKIEEYFPNIKLPNQ